MRFTDMLRFGVVASTFAVVHAAEPPSSSVTYNINYQNVDVQVIVNALAAEMGKVIIVDQAARSRISWTTPRRSQPLSCTTTSCGR